MRKSIILLSCAWVLWQYTMDAETGRRLSDYGVVSASVARHECENPLTRALAENAWKEMANHAHARVNAMAASQPPPAPKSVAMYVCLPDTIDPRGAKR